MVISGDSLVPRVEAFENIGGGRVYFLSVLRYPHAFLLYIPLVPIFGCFWPGNRYLGDTFVTLTPGSVSSVSHRFRDLPGSWREA